MSAARQLLPLLALVATLPLISAHGSLTNIAVGGKEYPSWIPSQDHYAAMNFKGGAGAAAPDGKYLRKNDVLDNGYTDPASAAIATGGTKEGALYDEMSPVRAIPMNAGDAVTFDLGTWPEGHSGPILSHMASCGAATCTGVDATTLDWFAIHHAGYDATAKIWPTDVLASTGGGALTINLPKDLPGGAYLLRFELIAMHSVPAQFYPWAAEIDLTSSGSALPSAEYMGKFPDMYSAAAGNMALDFSLYSGNDLMSFVLPGVPVYPGGSSTGNDPRADGSAAPTAPDAPAPATTGNETAPATAPTASVDPAASDPAATVSDVASGTSILPTASEIAGNPIEGAPAASATSETITTASTTSELIPETSDTVPSTTDAASAPGMTDIPAPLPETTDIDANVPVTSDAQATATATDDASLPVETSEGASSAIESASGSASAPGGVETAEVPASPTESDAGMSEVVPTAIATEAGSSTVEAAEPTDSAVTPPPATGSDEVQEVQENDGRTVYKWNGETFNFKNDAYYHRCDKKRNDCLNSANALPNAEVESARQACETEAPACYSSISSSMRRRRRSARSHI